MALGLASEPVSLRAEVRSPSCGPVSGICEGKAICKVKTTQGTTRGPRGSAWDGK